MGWGGWWIKGFIVGMGGLMDCEWGGATEG